MRKAQCRLCKTDNLKKLQLSDYYFCCNCHYIMLSANLLPDPQTEKKRYQNHDNTRENQGYVDILQEFINWGLKDKLTEIDVALDYGCGPGPVLAELLEELGLRVNIYDPFFYPDLDFKGQKYDLITATEVFEHFHHPLTEIKELIRLLSPGGFLAITTNFHPGPKDFPDWWYHRDPTHVGFYNKKTIHYITAEFSLNFIKTGEEKFVLWQKS